MTKEQIIAMIIIILVLVILFIVSYLLNKKTPKPKGCENLEEDCSSCPIGTCLKNTSKKEE